MRKLLDIFSKRKPKKKEKIKIIIDNREKNSLIPSILSEKFQIEYRQLPVADYLIKDTAIERKTISDFKSSIVNKRIISQLLELKQYPRYFLVLEGFNKNIYEGGIHENAFRGFLLSVALEYRVPVIFTEDAEDTAKYLSVLALKIEKPEPSIRASKILKSKKEQIQFILEGFPYIGPVTAKKLLKKFKSIKNIINAEEDELKSIIGKKGENLYKLINSK